MKTYPSMLVRSLHAATLSLVLVAAPAMAARVISASSGGSGEGGLPFFIDPPRTCSAGDFNNPLVADYCLATSGASSAAQADALAAGMGWIANPVARYQAVRESFTTSLPTGTAFSFRYRNDFNGGAVTSYLDPSTSAGNWIVALSGMWGAEGSQSPWSAAYAFGDLIFAPGIMVPGTLGFSLNVGSPYTVRSALIEGTCPTQSAYVTVDCLFTQNGPAYQTNTTYINLINGLTVDDVSVFRYAVPEPTSGVLALAALLGLAGLRRRTQLTSPASRARA